MNDTTSAVAARRWRPRIAPWSVVVALVVTVVDQITKHWAVNELADNREIHVIWTLQWNLSFNTGMAFSQGEGLGPFIAVLAMLIVIVLVVSSAHVESRLARFAAGLLIGGATGNLIDRLFRGDGWLHGAVVDFIDFQWFPIFNVADMGVTVGATLFAIAVLFEGRSDGDTVDGETVDGETIDDETIDDEMIDDASVDDTIRDGAPGDRRQRVGEVAVGDEEQQ